MDILVVIIVLLILLFAASWSAARSYFIKGRLDGMEAAAVEVVRGIGSHYESVGRPLPEDVAKALDALRTFARSTSCEQNIKRFEAGLWGFGDAVGAACWRRGYEACREKLSARPDRIRIDLPVDQLLHLAALAHLGFKKMMPNDRAIETLRFEGEEHAMAVAYAVERLEQALPEAYRPSGHLATRQAMIRHWWPLQRKRA
ncbi:hypothetical protein [Bradyrhizobium sp.]|uniref:hypothetical protein n=1 Tax=Bradyrhizobium sp. TaxID=376 RepID=UPI003C41EE0A